MHTHITFGTLRQRIQIKPAITPKSDPPVATLKPNVPTRRKPTEDHLRYIPCDQIKVREAEIYQLKCRLNQRQKSGVVSTAMIKIIEQSDKTLQEILESWRKNLGKKLD